MFNDRDPRPWEDPRPVPPFFGGPEGYDFPPPVNPWNKILRKNSNIVFGSLLLLMALLAGAPILIYLLVQMLPIPEQIFTQLPSWVLLAGELILSALVLLIPFLLMVFLLDIPGDVVFPRRIPRMRILVPGVFCCLGMSAAGVLVSGYLQVLLAETIGAVPIMPDQAPPYGLWEGILYFAQVALIPAVLEELIFRGAVLQPLRRFGDGFALVVSSILFACAHGNLVQAPNAMLSGMVLGYFALRSGGLIVPMAMHFANNGIAALVNLAMLYLPAESYELLNFIVLPLYLVLGIVGAILMLVFNRGFIPPFSAEVGMREGEKYRRFFTTPLAVLFLVLAVYITGLNFAWI